MMAPPVHLPPAKAREAQALIERANWHFAEGVRLNEQAARLMRVAPAKLKDGDEDVGNKLLPAWHLTIGNEWVQVSDLRNGHPTTALARFMQGFDKLFDNETEASQALGLILGRLAASGCAFGGYVLRLRGKLNNANQWECCPLNQGESVQAAP
jgi:hypothetical protein